MIDLLILSSKKTINYYVSNSGDSGNNGLTPLTAITPDSIGLLDKSKPCKINFNRGETFHIQIDSINEDITYSSYGTGAAPVFDGSIDISSLTWTDEGGGIFSTPMVNFPMWIIINGACAKISQSNWILIENVPSGSNFEVNTADITYSSIVGARLIHKYYNWAVEKTYTVSAYDNITGYITVAEGGLPTSASNWGLQLFGLQEFFVDNNEWAWESGVLYIKSTVSPSTMNIREVEYDYGVWVQDGAHNNTIENIEFKHYHNNAIRREIANNFTLRNSNIHDLRGHAIKNINLADQLNIYNNQFSNCAVGVGVYRSTLIPNIYSNTFLNMGMQANYSWNIVDAILPIDNPYSSIGTGILLDNFEVGNTPSVEGYIFNNDIRNCAYVGILCNGNVDNYLIYRNIIIGYLNRFSDGGGIHTHGRLNPRQDVQNFEIYNNIVGGAVGTSEGTGITPVARGIYLDNFQENTFVHNNIIFDCQDSGIHVNWETRESRIEDNIIVGCKYSVSYKDIDGKVFQNTENLSFRNIFAVRGLSEYCYATDKSASYNPWGGAGNSDNNYFFNPYSTFVTLRNLTTDLTFIQQQTGFNRDLSSTSKTNWLTYVDEATAKEQVKLYTNETDSDIQQLIPAGYEDVDGNDISGQTLTVYARQNGTPGLLILKTTN